MFRRLITVFLLSSIPISALGASRIADVVVYGDRAQVTRTEEVTVKGGDVDLNFGGLPAALDDQSVQVWGAGAAKATLEGVTVDLEPAPEAPAGKVGELTTRIEQLRDRKNMLLDKRKGLGATLQLLAEIRPEKIRPEDKITWGNVSEIEQIVATIALDLRNIFAQYRALDTELKNLDKEIEALEKELQKIQSPSQNRTKSITVKLSVTNPGSLKVVFSYILPGAGWKALYDIRALPDEGEVEITEYAEIVQRTGEDWNNVTLSVSTARPSIGGTPPKFNPIYLVFYAPPPPPAPRALYRAEAPTAAPPPSPAPGTTGAYEEEEATEAVLETAQAQHAGTAVFFEIKQKKDIPSDGEPHRVAISVDRLKADFDHASWPEAKAMAFLRAKIKNNTGHALIAGKANVFVGPRFIGTTQIADWADTEEKTISLGIDQGVRIERTVVKRDENEVGSKKVIAYEFKIEVKNFKGKPINMEIFDRIPSSRQGDIEVKVEAITPEPAKREETGIVSWNVRLDAGAKTEIRLSYTIRYPKDRQVVGLP